MTNANNKNKNKKNTYLINNKKLRKKMGKDAGETSKKLSRRPLKSLIGVVILAIYNFIPGIMFYIYYKAVMGSILCITLSIIQITV